MRTRVSSLRTETEFLKTMQVRTMVAAQLALQWRGRGDEDLASNMATNHLFSVLHGGMTDFTHSS